MKNRLTELVNYNSLNPLNEDISDELHAVLGTDDTTGDDEMAEKVARYLMDKINPILEKTAGVREGDWMLDYDDWSGTFYWLKDVTVDDSEEFFIYVTPGWEDYPGIVVMIINNGDVMDTINLNIPFVDNPRYKLTGKPSVDAQMAYRAMKDALAKGKKYIK